MRKHRIFGPVVFTVLIMLMLTSFIVRKMHAPPKVAAREPDKGFALLELFTSEGCSSCPPADELLAKVQRESAARRVYLLAYHVDYWDRQGWRDPFSSADFSKRQSQYGDWLHVSPIYTPQLVINGEAQFVGSDESLIRKEISEQLSVSPSEKLLLDLRVEDNKAIVKYTSSVTIKAAYLAIAVVQKFAEVKVERGENAGHTLKHVQIVRKLQTQPLSTNEGIVTIAIPSEFKKENLEILGFVQNQKSGKILCVSNRIQLVRSTVDR